MPTSASDERDLESEVDEVTELLRHGARSAAFSDQLAARGVDLSACLGGGYAESEELEVWAVLVLPDATVWSLRADDDVLTGWEPCTDVERVAAEEFPALPAAIRRVRRS